MKLRKIEVALLENLWRVAMESGRHVDAMLREAREISRAQLVVLHTLFTGASTGSLSDLAKILRCSNANAGQLVAGLIERGHVRKVENADARVTQITLTFEGIDAHTSGESQLEVDAETIFAPLDAQEKEQLLALLSKITFTAW